MAPVVSTVTTKGVMIGWYDVISAVVSVNAIIMINDATTGDT